jgi:hypothetical protein
VLDRSNPDQPTVELFVDRTRDGEPFFEEVPVEPLTGDRYRILASPGLLDGVAAGDVFERRPDGTYAVVERSGNLCVQVWHPDVDVQDRFDAELLPGAIVLGGWLDGRTEGSTVLTFPLSAGFQRIERLLDGWVDATEGSTWSFGNVYADDGRTPLGWWEEERFRGQSDSAADNASRSES